MSNDLLSCLSTLLATAELGMAELNQAGQIVLASTALAAMFGYTADELRDQPLNLLLPGDLSILYAQPAQRVAVSGRHKEKHLFPVKVNLSQLPIGEQTVTVIVIANVTANEQQHQKHHEDAAGQPSFMQGSAHGSTTYRHEDALRRSEQIYRTLAHNIPNGTVFLVDHDLRFTMADGQGMHRNGYSREEIVGKTLREVLSPTAYALQEPLYRAALRGQQTVHETISGPYTFVTYYLPVRNEQGDVFAGMTISHDISKHKQAEAALIEERTLLTQRVQERTADLSAANVQLARNARLKDEFLANMSHELRTPLNAILGLSEVLREHVYGSLNEQQGRTLQTIEESGRHLLELINDILDLTKIGAGKLDLDIKPVLVEQVCQASLRLVSQAAQKKHIAIRITFDPRATHMQADERRLKQILTNLLSNAVKFTIEGGKIGLDVTLNAEHTIQFAVWDTGIGIAAEQQGHLFKPFIQLDSRLTRKYEGTGLGLALVYHMAELHGGTIALSSEIGVGSRFTLSLPWQPDNLQPPVELATTRQPTPFAPAQVSTSPIIVRNTSQGKPTILLAEDSENIIMAVASYLNMVGYHVIVARNGVEAVTLARETQPALILMDVHMPEMDGLEATRRIRADPIGKIVPIIALTALAMPSDNERCTAAGANGYLSKPVSLKVLAANIAAYLQQAATLI